jgi:hypothetical protein
MLSILEAAYIALPVSYPSHMLSCTLQPLKLALIVQCYFELPNASLNSIACLVIAEILCVLEGDGSCDFDTELQLPSAERMCQCRLFRRHA